MDWLKEAKTAYGTIDARNTPVTWMVIKALLVIAAALIAIAERLPKLSEEGEE